VIDAHSPTPPRDLSLAEAISALRVAQRVVRRRIGGFVCHLAVDLPETDVRALTLAIAARAGAEGTSQSGLGGRVTAWEHDITSFGTATIKEYRRGGLLRRVRRRHYLRFGPTRPEQELRMMRMARAAGVSVPEPILCLTRGMLVYRGWLATRRIEGHTLAHLRSTDAATLGGAMTDVARQVRLLVGSRIAHVDLHPGNVMVDPEGRAYLLDFDKATVFPGPLRDLREQYYVRWKRAVEKHGLPWSLAERFMELLLDGF
jgi:3-deoxy-D-manno-octulosonic acid kinase